MSRPRSTYLLLALLIFLVEVLIATRWSGHRAIRGSIGDFLVVLLIYCTLRPLLPKVGPGALALGVLALAFAIEAGQYFHLADRLGFRRGSIPSIVLGNTFSFGDLLMYALGSATAWLADGRPWVFSRR